MLNLFKSRLKKDPAPPPEEVKDAEAPVEDKTEPAVIEEEELVIKDLDKERAELAAKSVPSEEADPPVDSDPESVVEPSAPVEDHESVAEPSDEAAAEPVDLDKPLPDLIQDDLKIDSDEDEEEAPPAIDENEAEDFVPKNLDEEAAAAPEGISP